MKIFILKISRGFLTKEFEFDQTTLIHSNKNSVGKTTLLRMLLHSMGYTIPQTKGIRFSDYEYNLLLETQSSRKLNLIRKGDLLSIEEANGKVVCYSLPIDLNQILSVVFEISNVDLLDNLLGSFYIDQEKGWTLLNRGKVIGNISFNIEKLVLGLSSRSCDYLYSELKDVETELKKYQYMFNTAEYKKQLNDYEGETILEPEIEIIEKDLQILKINRQSLLKEVKRIEEVIRNNNSFRKYVSSMKMYVENKDGIRIPVNANTIVNFEDSMYFVKTKRDMINNQIVDLDNEIGKYESKIKDQLSIFKVKTKIEEFDHAISKINIDYVAIDKIIVQLKKKRKNLKEEITNYVKGNNDIVKKLHFLISQYAKELGIDERYVSPNKDYIFTSDLKSLSGTIFHKIVFAFKMAYIRIIYDCTGIHIPIILDSPSGREIKAEEVADMMKILVREYSEHQIIISSIHKYELICPKIITITDVLLGF